MRKTVGILMVLAAWAVAAQAEPLRVKVGAASSEGEVSFTLSVELPADPSLEPTPDTDTGTTPEEGSFPEETPAPEESPAEQRSAQVVAYVPGAMTAQEKAVLIYDAVAAADEPGTWRAVFVSGTSMTFEHLVGEEWLGVDAIANLADTTGGGSQLQATDQVVEFSLDIDPFAFAFGFDMEGNPSFITIAVTNTLTFTRPIQMGDTAETLVGQFEVFLLEQEAEGVSVTRAGATSLKILLSGSSSSAINWQVTDVGLVATGGGEVVGDDGSARNIIR